MTATPYFICALVVTVLASNLREEHRKTFKKPGYTLLEFEKFKQTHGKSYPDYESEDKALRTFSESLNKVEEHNKLHNSTTYGINFFSDMSLSEYQRRTSCMAPFSTEGFSPYTPREGTIAPSSWDWRYFGAITAVKNQGALCGSCYAFISIGAIEARLFIKEAINANLSSQEVVDCCTLTHGCKSGLHSNVFLWAKDNTIVSDQEYPYVGQEGVCKATSKRGFRIRDPQLVPTGREDLLQLAVYEGPVAVSVDGSLESFKRYRGGVYRDPACSTTELTHGLLLVGYGTDPIEGPYWIGQNSHGITWGEFGFIRIERGANRCGISSHAAFPNEVFPSPARSNGM